MKSVSVSAELATIQQAVEAAGMIVEIGRQGGVEDEDTGALCSAILALAACRLRDLGRVVRGTMPVELFLASHNAAVEGSDGEDLILHPATTAVRGRGKK